jgi:hypothetical protein
MQARPKCWSFTRRFSLDHSAASSELRAVVVWSLVLRGSGRHLDEGERANDSVVAVLCGCTDTPTFWSVGPRDASLARTPIHAAHETASADHLAQRPRWDQMFRGNERCSTSADGVEAGRFYPSFTRSEPPPRRPPPRPAP